MILALGLSYFTISLVNYRILLVGLGSMATPNQLQSSSVVATVNYGASGGSNPSSNTNPPPPPKQNQRIQLTVIVLEDTSSGRRSASGILVNVTEPGELSRSGAGEVVALGGQMIIAAGKTDHTGTVAFELDPGDYTVLAKDLGLVGELPITLHETKTEVTVQWVFHSEFEPPLLVQMNDLNSDGIISPDETISLFFQAIDLKEPHRIVLLVEGPGQFSIDLKVVAATLYQNGIYVALSPTGPVPMSSLRFDSAILIGTIWYEVSIAS